MTIRSALSMPQKYIPALLCSGLLVGLLGSCAPPQNYAGEATNVSRGNMERTLVDVSSKTAWQDSGVYLNAGETIRVSATGKWSPWPLLGLWSGPEGNSAWKGQVPFIPASALMGRLGVDGKPFYIGAGMVLTAKKGGRLYLAMNDVFSSLWDNLGKMQVAIWINYAKPAPK